MNNFNLIRLRELRDEEKALKRVINDTKDAAITEAFEYAPEGGTFTIDGVGKYTLKLNPTIDLKDEKGKFARAWQKKQLEYNDLQEQIDAIKRKQSDIQEDMDKLGEKHIEATAQSEKPYQPKYKPSISVLYKEKVTKRKLKNVLSYCPILYGTDGTWDRALKV